MGNNPKNYFKITLRKKMKFFTAALREIQWGIHDAKATVNAINGALGTGGDVIIDGLEGDIINALAIIQKGWEDSDFLIYDEASSMGYGTHTSDPDRFAWGVSEEL